MSNDKSDEVNAYTVLGLSSKAPADVREAQAWEDALMPLHASGPAPGPELWARIEAAVDLLEAAPATRTVPLAQGTWETLLPGIERKVLHIDRAAGVQQILFRMQAGVVLPGHAHHADEHCVVVSGELRIGETSFTAGAYHFASRGTPHPPITALSDALFYISGAL